MENILEDDIEYKLAVVYLRVSTDKQCQFNSQGLDFQLAECKTWASKNQVKIRSIYKEKRCACK